MDSERPAELPPEKPKHRHVSLRREETGRYLITNARGGTLTVGGSDDDFTAVELLLSAIAACSSIDVDYVTGRRAQPDAFDVDVDAQKTADERGNHLEDIVMTFKVRFPDGDAGDAARRLLPDIVRKSHERLCTVSRTIMLGTDITARID
jgi:putative redox protein